MATRHGLWQGKHYTQYVGTVNALKREGKVDEAIDLLGHLVDATEQESAATGQGVAPWYYEQLGILHRKVGDHAAEVAILERFAQQHHAPGAKPAQLMARLEKVRDRR
jgi:hypothetical protein